MSTTTSIPGTTLPPLASSSSASLPQSQPAPSTTIDPNTYHPPPYTTFPPFYTLQPNTTTQTRQLELWSSHILTYCAHPSHRLFRLSITSPPPALFSNSAISRSLKPADIRTVLDFMSTAQGGGQSIEYIPPATKGESSNAVYVWWRSASEWADLVYGWVDGTGQKGAVLTVYELREGDGEGGGGAAGREWEGMDEGMLRKVLGVLVKRGKAQIFGEGGGEGVKFF